MFNLLLKTEKDALRREYRTRLAAVWLGFLCVTALVAGALLLPSYIFSAQKEKVAANRVEMLARSAGREEATALAIGMSFKNKVAGLPLGGGKGAILLAKWEHKNGEWKLVPINHGSFEVKLQAGISEPHRRSRYFQPSRQAGNQKDRGTGNRKNCFALKEKKH